MSFDLNHFYAQLDGFFAKRDNELVERYLRSALEEAKMDGVAQTLDSADGNRKANLAYVAVCNELASFLRGLSRFNESLAVYDAAKEELRSHGQEQSAHYATVLLNEAGCWRYMQKPHKALELFLQAAEIFSLAPEKHPQLLAGLYNNIALVYLDLQQADKARTYLQQALEICKKIPDMRQELGITWNNLANACYALGQKEEAFYAANQAIQILGALSDGQDAHYPAALHTRGMLQFSEGNVIQALEDFQQSLTKTRQVFGENVDYMITCSNCALCCRKLGRDQEAQKWEDKYQALKARLMD